MRRHRNILNNRDVSQFLVCLVVATAAVTFSSSGGNAQETKGIELVPNSQLPNGQGIAQKFDVDQNIESHPSVIFADNFESGKVGEKWDGSNAERNDALSFDGGALKIIATLGKNNGGGLTKWFEPVDRIFVRFYTKFDKNCDYVHHFCTLRANKSLQGNDRWTGFGGAGLKPDGTTRFSTAIEPWGKFGQWPAPGRWNFYSYWSTMNHAPDGKYWGNSFVGEGQNSIEKDKWICMEFMLKHNTPSQPDGEQAYWIDGKLQGHWRGFQWRDSPTLFANAFTLESYVTDLWTKHPVNIVYFDNVVIASEYIGPTGDR